MAYMTNDFLAAEGGAGTACSGGFTRGEPCPDSPSYLAQVESGIFPQPADRSLKSQFVEVFPPDVNRFPDAIWQAHLDLVS